MTNDTRTIHSMVLRVLSEKFSGSQPALARALGVSQQAVSQWVLGKTSPRGERAEAILQWIASLDAGESPDSPSVDIPRLRVEASAGPGSFTDEAASVEMVRISKAWLSAHLSCPHNCLAIVTAKGDSMEPTFKDGDLLLVDTSAELDRDAVFVFSSAGRLFVKRLQRRLDGSLVAISDNRAHYEPFPIPADTEIHIHGRVLCVWKIDKL